MKEDHELVLAVRGGDMRAFDVLYERYEARLFGFCVKLLGDRADAEEVFHEAFLNTLKQRDVEFAEGGFRAYLFRAARNLCSNRRRGRERFLRAKESMPAREARPLQDEALDQERRAAALELALSRLPPPMFELYELRASGLSYEEMASVLSIPLGTLKSRMSALMKLLREEVKGWTAT